MTGLQFQLEFRKGRGASNVAALTVFVDAEAVWPVAHAPDVSLEIPADDLLSHLVEFWAPLTLRQTWPLPVAVTRPTDLRAAAERRWEAEPAETAEREDAALSNFEEAHDLSLAFSGYFDLAPLFLLRRGETMIVDTRAGFRLVDYDAAVRELARVGDEIAERLGREGERWARLVGLWRQREAKDPLSLLVWATGLTREVAERLTREGVLPKPASFADIANDNDELRIAARMAGALPPDQIGETLSLIAGFPKLQAAGLDALAGEISNFIAERHAKSRAHEQGEIAARRVRERLGLSALEACDIAAELERLGVGLEFRPVEPDFRALAIDGRRHGPIAFINTRGPHRNSGDSPRSNWSARVDLAHEFAHLLLDRGHALGAVEVLNSRMPVEIEQRAKSFAGEFLAPTEAVSAAWREAGNPRALEPLRTLIFDLQKTFGVTKAVATWKLQHATERVDVDISLPLDQIAPKR